MASEKLWNYTGKFLFLFKQSLFFVISCHASCMALMFCCMMFLMAECEQGGQPFAFTVYHVRQGYRYLFWLILIFRMLLMDRKHVKSCYEQETGNMPSWFTALTEDKETKWRKAVHEAGHIVMAEYLGIEVLAASINRIEIPKVSLPTSEDIQNNVYILYAGTLAEELLTGMRSRGFYGSENADKEKSNVLIKEYVQLTEKGISLSGLEEEKIRKKSIELSIQWGKEVEHILENQKEKIQEIAEKLLEEGK